MMKKMILVTMACTALALSACLPENSDPDKTAQSAGQLSGAFYGNGLGSVALALQNTIVTQSDWFSHVNNGEVNMAAMGISASGMGAPVKSFLCANPTGQGVKQITWLDARDGSNKFALRGIGADAGSIVGSLRNRVGGNQIGVYKGGSDIEMVNGTTFNIPAGCGTAQIPLGAPVLAFDIDRPAPPTVEMARTEYRTVPCSADSTGRQMRGTMVQNRTVRYLANGTITPSDPNGGWTSDANSMGQCMNDVVVEVTQRDFIAGSGTVNMNNFAAIALRTLLQEQLQMDCSNTAVRMDGEVKRGQEKSRRSMTKAINTCPLSHDIRGSTMVSEGDAGDATDRKVLDCKGITALILREFPNLYGDGLRNTVWLTGTATLLRTLDNRSNEADQQAKRYEWLGTDINCGGYQTFYVTCDKIPGNPPVEARHQWNKWIDEPLKAGYKVHSTWLNKVFGTCIFGSCVKVTGVDISKLNPEYFTGVDQIQNNGSTSIRSMGVDGWLNNRTFLPKSIPTTIWRINDNQCLWSQRVMIADCPFYYDAARQGDWDMTSISAQAARPVALDPGISNDGTDAGFIYTETRLQGHLTALIVMHWEKKTIKGTKRWDESFGPGKGAYIKSWNGEPPTTMISLTAEQVAQRSQMCTDVDYQLNAYTIMKEKEGIKNQKLVIKNEKQKILTDAQKVLDNTLLARAEAQKGYDDNMGDYYYWSDAAYNEYVAAGNAARDSAWYSAASGQCNSTYYVPFPDTRREYNWQTDTWVDVPFTNYYEDCNGWWPDFTQAAADSQRAADEANARGDAYTRNADASYRAAQTYVPAINAANALIPGQTATRDAANVVFLEAKGIYDIANEKYLIAKDINDEHLVHDLTEEELTALGEVQSLTCTSAAGNLDEGSQINYKQSCAQYYANPDLFARVPSVGNFCNMTFKREGEDLIFNAGPLVRSGTNVLTTLLNREGVDLAWRPQLEGNARPGAETYLNTRQKGFVNPLMCARSEYEYINWPVLRQVTSCGGKGGCRTNTISTTCTVIKSTAREWSGLSYETGTWSRPQTIYMASWGASYSDASQIPSPYTTYGDCNVLPVNTPAPPPPPAPTTPACLMAKVWTGGATTGMAYLELLDGNSQTYRVTEVEALSIDKWNKAENASTRPSQVTNLPYRSTITGRTANSIIQNEGYKICNAPEACNNLPGSEVDNYYRCPPGPECYWQGPSSEADGRWVCPTERENPGPGSGSAASGGVGSASGVGGVGGDD